MIRDQLFEANLTAATGPVGIGLQRLLGCFQGFAGSQFLLHPFVGHKFFAPLQHRVGQSEAGVKGSFFTANTYKQIFFMFDQTAENKSLPLIFEKMATGAGVNVTIDNVFIEPAHPAILDR